MLPVALSIRGPRLHLLFPGALLFLLLGLGWNLGGTPPGSSMDTGGRSSARLAVLGTGAVQAASEIRGEAIPLRSIVINEVMPLPREGEVAWVELYNDGSDLYLPLISTTGSSQAGGRAATRGGILAGWQLSDEDGQVYTFPVTLTVFPAGTYVVVYFDGQGEAANDYDFSDGRAELHTPPGLVAPFEAVDQVALYSSGVHTVTTLVDFVAFGGEPGAQAEVAVQAGLWPDLDLFAGPTEQVPGGDALRPGGSIGLYPFTRDADGPEAWSIYRPEEVSPGTANVSPSPYLRNPTSGSTVLAGPVAFGWAVVPQATAYRLQVARQPDFSAPLVDRVITDTMFTVELTATEVVSTTYRFRVRAEQPTVSAWSPVGQVAVLSMPSDLQAAGPAVFHKVLNVRPQLQHKDTLMLCLDGDPEFGPGRWDASHEVDGDRVVGNANPVRANVHDNWYCTRASISMLADYYGKGQKRLSQDRISFYAFGGGAPEGDLGHGRGMWPNQRCTQGGGKNVLWWAMNDDTGVCSRGKPTFAQLKGWIDAGRPGLFVENNDTHSVVVAGYAEFILFGRLWQFAYRVDPWTATGGWIEYSTWNVTEYHVPPAGVDPRADEPSLWTDQDGDGIVDFDEANRFPTLLNRVDTDEDCVPDKQDIRGYVFDNLGNYSPRWPDWDRDGLRKEVDRDNDNDGAIDGDEDQDWDGRTVDRWGRRDGRDTSNFSIWERRGPGPCSTPPPTSTPTSTPILTPTPTFTPPTPTPTPTATATPPVPPPTATPTLPSGATPTPTITPSSTPTWTPTATPTSTPTPTSTATPTPTPTATSTPTPTPTPTATPTSTPTPTPVPVLTGITATFQEDSTLPGNLDIQIHVLDPDLDGQVYDIELYFHLQEPPWKSLEWVQLPPGWSGEILGPGPDQPPTGGRAVTANAPMRTCQPLNFRIAVESTTGSVGNTIIIYLTDANHQVIGQIAAQRKTGSRQAVRAWLLSQAPHCTQ